MTEPQNPQRMVVSSVRLEEGAHDQITIFNRGANAGTIIVRRGDGAILAERLREEGPHLRVEPARETHIMSSISIIRGPGRLLDDREAVWIEPQGISEENGESVMILHVGSVYWHEDGRGERGTNYEVRFYPDRRWDSAGAPRITSRAL